MRYFFRLFTLVALVVSASTAAAQTLNTTTTFDGTSGSYSGVLTIDSNGGQTPTLYLLNGATQTAGLSVVFVGNQYTGALSLQGASSLSNSGVAILANFEGTSTGTATVAGGSRWTSGGNLFVGGGGNGYLNINSGGVVSNSNGFVAYGQGFNGQNVSTGTALVSGVGSTWNNNRLFVGGNLNNAGGTGSLNVSAGGAVNVTETLRIWNPGTVTLHSGSITAYAVDNSAGGVLALVSGTLNLNGGRYTHNAGSGGSGNILSLNSNENGESTTLNLLSGATVVGAEAMVIGHTGRGQLAISGGSVLTNTGDGATTLGSLGATSIANGQAVLGYNSVAAGTASILGTGSKWQLGDRLYVGYGGVGSMLVAAGGNVQSAFGIVGQQAGAQGSVTLSGGTSAWKISSNLYVGRTGSGSVEVQHGAKLMNQTGFIGLDAGSVGNVVVQGVGSQWSVTGNLFVGGSTSAGGGTGTVTLTNGGNLVVGNQLKIWSTGTVEVNAGSSLNAAVNNAGTLVLNGTLTGGVALVASGTLGGSGVVTGAISGAGLVSPGNSPGILTASQVDPTSGLDFLFQFTTANTAPTYGNPTNSLNDVLHLTHGTDPFMSSIFSPANTITINFEVGSLVDGQYYLGAFFTNLPGTDFVGNGTLSGAEFKYLLNGAPLDESHWMISITSVAQAGVDFGGGPIAGRVTKFQVTEITAVPEPSSLLLCGTAAVGYFLRRRKAKRSKNPSEPRT